MHVHGMSPTDCLMDRWDCYSMWVCGYFDNHPTLGHHNRAYVYALQGLLVCLYVHLTFATFKMSLARSVDRSIGPRT